MTCEWLSALTVPPSVRRFELQRADRGHSARDASSQTPGARPHRKSSAQPGPQELGAPEVRTSSVICLQQNFSSTCLMFVLFSPQQHPLLQGGSFAFGSVCERRSWSPRSLESQLHRGLRGQKQVSLFLLVLLLHLFRSFYWWAHSSIWLCHFIYLKFLAWAVLIIFVLAPFLLLLALALLIFSYHLFFCLVFVLIILYTDLLPLATVWLL